MNRAHYATDPRPMRAYSSWTCALSPWEESKIPEEVSAPMFRTGTSVLLQAIIRVGDDATRDA